jgi:Uma2 family endonuclease
MLLGGEVRGADGAVWRRADLGEHTGGYRRTPPVLAVEVAGRDDDETSLREKAAWYLGHGVAVVWIVLPSPRRVIVLDASGEAGIDAGGCLPPHAALPGLEPEVASFFAQLGAG